MQREGCISCNLIWVSVCTCMRCGRSWALLFIMPYMSCMVCDQAPLRLVTRTKGMLASISLLLP
jgi:hypothetical protein